MSATRVVDVTPKWTHVLPLLIAAIESGGFKAKEIATEELQNMARLADIGADAVKLQRDAIASGATVKNVGGLAGEWVR